MVLLQQTVVYYSYMVITAFSAEDQVLWVFDSGILYIHAVHAWSKIAAREASSTGIAFGLAGKIFLQAKKL
jgi:hypothetical protein